MPHPRSPIREPAEATPSRDAVLARYRPIRVAIQAVLAEAVKHCRKADLDRAARHLDLVDQAQLDDDDTFAMLCDVALFEPGRRGRRVIDAFLDAGVETLDDGHRDVARRLASAFFSIFRVAGWHEAGGVRLEDLLVPDRRPWVMDEGLEASAPEGLVIAMRVVDAGPFHAGFGIVVLPDAEAVTLCTTAASQGKPLPFRHSLAAALYGDAVAEAALPAALDEALALLDAVKDARFPLALPKPRPARSRRRSR